MTMENDRTMTLHVYTDIVQAKIIQDKLQEHGVTSFLNDENVLGMDPIAGGELRIFEKDREAAEKIITCS